MPIKASPYFSANEHCRRWLEQFPPVDRNVARQLVDGLQLVSHAEFELGIRSCIDEIREKTKARVLPVLTIDECAARRDTRDSSQLEKRQPADSSDHLAYILENIQRITGGKVLANPTVDSMRLQRVKHVVIVDDLVGTGKRLAKYWKKRFPPSVKSWISLKYTQIWVVAYAATEVGIAAATRAAKPLAREKFVTATAVVPRNNKNDRVVIALCAKYASRTSKPLAPLGFGNGATNIVFAHSCPNNAPAILWANGPKWRALFPDRGIPTEVAGEFERCRPHALGDELWTSGQYKLALKMVESVESGSVDPDNLYLIAMIGLISRKKRLDMLFLAKKMRLPLRRVRDLLKLARCMGLVDISNKATAFAHDLLAHTRVENSKPMRRKVERAKEIYYPDSCGGYGRLSKAG